MSNDSLAVATEEVQVVDTPEVTAEAVSEVTAEAEVVETPAEEVVAEITEAPAADITEAPGTEIEAVAEAVAQNDVIEAEATIAPEPSSASRRFAKFSRQNSRYSPTLQQLVFPNPRWRSRQH